MSGVVTDREAIPGSAAKAGKRLNQLPHRLVNDPRQKPAAFKIVGMTTRAANTSFANSRAARAAAT